VELSPFRKEQDSALSLIPTSFADTVGPEHYGGAICTMPTKTGLLT
jgi:hypothetical protein